MKVYVLLETSNNGLEILMDIFLDQLKAEEFLWVSMKGYSILETKKKYPVIYAERVIWCYIFLSPFDGSARTFSIIEMEVVK